MEKKKNQKLNEYSINIQNIKIDFTQNFRLKCHNSLSRPYLQYKIFFFFFHLHAPRRQD